MGHVIAMRRGKGHVIAMKIGMGHVMRCNEVWLCHKINIITT